MTTMHSVSEAIDRYEGELARRGRTAATRQKYCREVLWTFAGHLGRATLQDIGSDDYGGSILFESREDALSNAKDWEWLVSDDGKVTCESCQEDAKIEVEEASA